MPYWLTATMTGVLGAAILALAPGVATAAPLPQAVADMINAIRDDSDALKHVLAAARKANPDSVGEIDALAATLAAKTAQERMERVASQGLLEGWTGKGEVGGFLSTGSSDDRGLALGLDFGKETLRWRHVINTSADYRSKDHETTKEQYSAAYTANYKFTERFYAVATFSGERDRTADIKSRFTEGLGLGYRIVNTTSVKLGIEGGPALRQTDYYDIRKDNSVAALLAGNLAWTITPDTGFTQTAAAYLESGNSTLEATTALTMKLMDALAAKASFDIRHETDPSPGEKKTDTTTRMTLVYSF